jgi:hypothetical protein
MFIDLKITGTTNNTDLVINNPDYSDSTDESEAVE